MRISIRRCLSMLRNTSAGNELAVPATNACNGHSVGYRYTVSYVLGAAGYYCWLLAVVCC